MKSLKNLFFTLLLSLPLSVSAQDTLVAEILITKDSLGYNISFTKNLYYPDVFIKYLIDTVVLDTIPPKQEETPRIIRM